MVRLTGFCDQSNGSPLGQVEIPVRQPGQGGDAIKIVGDPDRFGGRQRNAGAQNPDILLVHAVRHPEAAVWRLGTSFGNAAEIVLPSSFELPAKSAWSDFTAEADQL